MTQITKYTSILFFVLYSIIVQGQTITAKDSRNATVQIDIDKIFYAIRQNASTVAITQIDKTEVYTSSLLTLSDIQKIGCNKFYLFRSSKNNASIPVNDSILMGSKYSQVQQTSSYLAIISTVQRGYTFETIDLWANIIKQTNTICATYVITDDTITRYKIATRKVVDSLIQADTIRDVFLSLTSYTDLQAVPLNSVYPIFMTGGVIKDGMYRLMTYSPDNLLKRINLTGLGGQVGSPLITNQFPGNGNYIILYFKNGNPLQHRFIQNGWQGVLDSIRYNRELTISNDAKMKVLQKCGYPTYKPKLNEWHVVIDTCNSLTYLYDHGTWYNQTNIISESAPFLTTTSGSVQISNTKISWFKPSTQSWYDVQYGAWLNRRAFNVDSLLLANNIWWGKNTFKDTVTLEKRMLAKDGIDSDGIINTKGLTSTAVITTKGLTSDSMVTSVGVKTSGTSTKAASENNGVQKDAVIEVTVNTTLDGTYNTIVGVPSSSDIVLTLPVIAAENNGWKYVISKKNTSSYNVRVTASGFNHVIISPNSPVIIRNRGGTWQVE